MSVRRTLRARLGGRERGAAAVEAALVICFIVVPLTFAVISYGYMLSFRQSLSQAATEGARAAAVAPSGATDADTVATAAVNDSVQSFGKQCAATGPMTCSFVQGACPNDDTLQCETVTVSYDLKNHPLLPLPLVGFVMPDTLTYSATAQVSSP